jgi:hypothetical protein
MISNKILFAGCSYTAGNGWTDTTPEESTKIELKDSPYLWVNICHSTIDRFKNLELVNLGKGGASNTEIFENAGFKCKQSIDKSSFHEKHFQLHAPLQASLNGLNIDVHILLFDSFLGFEFDTEALLSKRQLIEWNQQKTYVLTANDAALFNLLHLYVHLDKGNHFKMSSFIDVQRTIHELNYPANKAQYSAAIQEKIEYIIDCMVWLGLIENSYLPQRKKAPARYFFYLLFFLQTLQPTVIQTLRYKFFPRLFLYSFSWKTLPLLFHEAFPSKRYLLYGAPNRSYLSAWIYRLKHFTRKK